MSFKKFYDISEVKKYVKVILEHNDNLIITERDEDKHRLRVARKVCFNIASYLKNISINELEKIDGRYVMYLDKIGYDNLALVFEYPDMTKSDNKTYICALGSWGTYDIISINLFNVPATKKFFESGDFESAWKALGSYAIHEIIHYLDKIRTSGKIRPEFDKDDKKSEEKFNRYKQKYPSTPVEFNGYFFEIYNYYHEKAITVDSWDEFYRQIGRSPVAFLNKIRTDPYTKDYILELKKDKKYEEKFNKRIAEIYYFLLDAYEDTVDPEPNLKTRDLTNENFLNYFAPSYLSKVTDYF